MIDPEVWADGDADAGDGLGELPLDMSDDPFDPEDGDLEPEPEDELEDD